MSLVGGDFEGDLDIIVSMPSGPPGTPQPAEDTGFRYRVFEVKSASVGADGVAKSLKAGKTRKIVKQLQKLEQFGCPNIFLFEIHVLQAGYSDKRSSMSPEILAALQQRYDALKNANYGYLLGAHEAIVGEDEDYTAVWHTPRNLLVPKATPPSSPFLELAEKINRFRNMVTATPKTGRSLPIIGYCQACKELIPMYVNDGPVCPGCSRFVL